MKKNEVDTSTDQASEAKNPYVQSEEMRNFLLERSWRDSQDFLRKVMPEGQTVSARR